MPEFQVQYMGSTVIWHPCREVGIFKGEYLHSVCGGEKEVC